MSTIERLKDLYSKSTQGKWFVSHDFSSEDPIVKTDSYSGEWYCGNIAMIVYDGLSDWERPSASADAEFIVEMHNALPKLLAVVDAANDLLTEMRVSPCYDHPLAMALRELERE